MRKIYKFSLFISILLIGYSLGKINNMNDVYEEEKIQIPKKNENMLSMMLETEAESGNYEMTTRGSWPTSGYKFNPELSKCENGGELSWDSENKRVLMSGNTSDKCYVYFDKEYLKILLNDYAFSWEPISNAVSYQIYSNDKLLTSTSDTSAEIYDYYNEPGSYNVSVKAVDDKNQVLLDSNVITYNLEGSSFDLTGDYIKSFMYITQSTIGTCNDLNYSTSTCWGGRFASASKKTYLNVSSKFVSNNYEINFVNLLTYARSLNVNYNRTYGGYIFEKNFSIAVNYCSLSNNCSHFPINDLSYIVDNIEFLFSDNMIKAYLNDNCSSPFVLAIQVNEVGKVPSEWKIVGFDAVCLSSNTDVYVYDRKKKKFKKKKIGELSYEDEILCWDFDNGEFAIAKPIWIKKCEQTNKYNLLKFSDGSTLETINQHRIFNVEKGMFTYPMSDDTPIGTTTFNSKGEYVKLVSKEVIEKPINYYNVMTEYHINLFANDILTSCRLSNMYKIKDMKYVCNKKRDNGYDLSKYDERLVNGLRLKEQDIEETKLRTYVDNMLRLMK